MTGGYTADVQPVAFTVTARIDWNVEDVAYDAFRILCWLLYFVFGYLLTLRVFGH